MGQRPQKLPNTLNEAYNSSFPQLEIVLKHHSTLFIRISKCLSKPSEMPQKCDLSDFDSDMIVCASRTGFSISETVEPLPLVRP